MFTYKGYPVPDALLSIDASYSDPHEAVISVTVHGPSRDYTTNPKELFTFVAENYAALSLMCAKLNEQWVEATGEAPKAPSTRH